MLLACCVYEMMVQRKDGIVALQLLQYILILCSRENESRSDESPRDYKIPIFLVQEVGEETHSIGNKSIVINLKREVRAKN